MRLLVTVGVALALLLVEWLFGDTLVDFVSDLLRGLDAVPAWMIAVFVVGIRILAVVVLGGGAHLGARGATLADAGRRVGVAVLLASCWSLCRSRSVDHDEAGSAWSTSMPPWGR